MAWIRFVSLLGCVSSCYKPRITDLVMLPYLVRYPTGWPEVRLRLERNRPQPSQPNKYLWKSLTYFLIHYDLVAELMSTASLT